MADLRRELSGLDAGSRGVPAVLHRAGQGGRRPRNGRRLLGRPDLLAGKVSRRSPGRPSAGVSTTSPRRARAPHCSRWPGSADCRRRSGRWRLCGGPDSDGTELLGVAATLMRDGYSPDLSPLYGPSAGPLHRIPPYVFDTSNRFWFDGAGRAPRCRRSSPRNVTPVAERQQPPRSRTPGGRGLGVDRRCRRLLGRRAGPVQPAR